MLIPYYGACEWRERNLRLVKRYWAEEFPDWQTLVVSLPGRALSLNEALSMSSGDVIVYADADSLVPPAQARQMVTDAAAGPVFVRGYSDYCRLTREASMAARASVPVSGFGPNVVEWQMREARSHGVAACRRSILKACHGYDPRFTGWGYDDLSLDLLRGARWEESRVEGPLYHLWHPADPASMDGHPLLEMSSALYERYCEHTGDWESLLAIREEASLVFSS